MVKLKYFGTSGIRGRTMIDITPILAHKMAFSFAKVLNHEGGLIVVGRDTRYGADLLEHAVISGLLAGGMNVVRCGVIPTPGLCERAKTLQACGSVMITGSHIPPERIGLIWQFSDGAYVDDESAAQIENIYDNLGENIHYCSLTKLGTVHDDIYARELYLEQICRYVPTSPIMTKKYRVVVDCANGTASHLAMALLQRYGCDVIAINDNFSPQCARISEPIAVNLQELIELVERTHADIGAAFDIDADRSAFVTRINDKVEVISANVIGTLLMDDMLKRKGGTVVLPVNTSGLASEVLARYNLKPSFCKIGQPATIELVKKLNSDHNSVVFSFEESGKFYHLEYGTLWTDALVNVLKVLNLMAESDRSLGELVNLYPRYYGGTSNLTMKNDAFRAQMPKIYEHMEKLPFGVAIDEIHTMDGYRINFADNSWLLIRPSGTEPKVRIVADAKSSDRAQHLTSLAKALISKTLGELVVQS